MITPDAPDWSSEDVSILRAFLATQTGQRFLPKLLDSVPPLLAAGDVNAILIRNGEVRGWQSVAREIFQLAFPIPEEKTDSINRNYPALDDEAAWKETP